MNGIYLTRTPAEWSVLMEALRREPASPGVTLTLQPQPVPVVVHELRTPDYAPACIKIQAAMHHLDEALPSRQQQRAESALGALEQGVAELRQYMRLAGYLP